MVCMGGGYIGFGAKVFHLKYQNRLKLWSCYVVLTIINLYVNIKKEYTYITLIVGGLIMNNFRTLAECPVPLFPNTSGWNEEDWDAYENSLNNFFLSLRNNCNEQEWEKQALKRWERVFAWLPTPLSRDGWKKFAWFSFVDRQLVVIKGRDEIGYHHVWLYCKNGMKQPPKPTLEDLEQNRWDIMIKEGLDWMRCNTGMVSEIRIKQQFLSRFFGPLLRLWWV